MNVERIKDIDIKEKNVYEKKDKNKSNGVERSICFYEDFIKLKEKILLKEKEIIEKRNKCLNKNEDNCSLGNKNKVIYRTFDEFYKYKKSYEEYENKRQKEALQLLNKRNINNNKQIIESISNNEKYSYIKFKKERQGTVKYLKEYFQKIQDDNLKKKKKNYLLNKLERKNYMTKGLVHRKKEKDENITNGDLTNDDITNDDITNDDITNDDIINDDIINDDITSDHITNDDITSDNITSDHITSDHITSDNITNYISMDNSKNLHLDNMNEQDIKLIQELIDAMKKDYKNDEDYISNLFEDLYNNNQTYMIDKIFHILKNIDKKVLLESTINTISSDDSHLHLNNNDMLINEDFLQTNKEKNSMEIIDIINNLDNCKDQNYNIQKINDNNKKEKNQEQEILDNMHEHMHDNKCNNGLEYNNNVNCNSDLHEVLWVKQNDNNNKKDDDNNNKKDEDNNNKKDEDNNNKKDDDNNNKKDEDNNDKDDNDNNNNDKDDDDDDDNNNNNNNHYNECIHTSTHKEHIHINNQNNNKLYIEDDNSENNKNEDYADKDINITKEKNNKLIKKIKQKSKKNIKDTNYTNKFDWFYNTINDIYEEQIVNNHQDDINYSLYDDNKDTFSDEDSEKNDMFLWLKNKDIENVLSEKRTYMDDNY
ncbi:conserved Plasmodium protein, unknown function [Plasmodium gaboni]|uniref:CCAAT-box DNA binding protein subunit B n=1 Tax=Plasmodium gaboni TaxID=647221 RepID=A0ABY1USX7_9APIC|nr:conserved Plasmodium protein, unknown function [Plasmodium gaboni]